MSSTPGTTTPSDSPETVRLCASRLDRDRALLRHLVGLEAVQDLVHDLAGADLPGAEREVEVLGLLEAHLADHRGEHARALELAVREVLCLEGLVERFAPLLLRLAARLPLVPLPDLVPRTRGRRERQPVARRAAARLRSEDLDEVAVLQPVVERDDPPVDLRADRPVADVRVDRVREVDRARPGRQRLHLALRGEDVHLVVEEVRAERPHELGGVLLVALPVHQRPHPLEPLVVLLARRARACRASARRPRAQPPRASPASAPGSRADAPTARSPSCAASGTGSAWASR